MKKIKEERIDDIVREITSIPYHHLWHSQDYISLYNEDGKIVAVVRYEILEDETLLWELYTYEDSGDLFKDGVFGGEGTIELKKYIEE